eukprot:CAMPEP_0179473344 /NCGR_PEP_ID=MMETSP0799-20121207/53097_1 /TAXON_ID=46947 /ORGANISM="Geminigera cryophila, Strain CCMP2564" /LENGTH=94 /DNA_ID=CAMNT_0021281907 /DNA_START=208 /DNA_END=492 /DNA_ORIENTATION=-
MSSSSNSRLRRTCPMLPEEAHGMLPEEEHDRAALPQPGLSEWVCSGSFVEIIGNGFGCWLSVSAGMPSRARIAAAVLGGAAFRTPAGMELFRGT